ncbi:MAG: hypothetical protein V2A79_12880 [Planctomycetota bacterium]
MDDRDTLSLLELWRQLRMTDAEQPGGRQFPTTEWSLVGRAGQGRSTAQRASLGQLLARYLPALRAHLVETKRIAPDITEDLLQGFVSVKFLEQNLAAHADRTRGKFRTLVLTALDRFIIDERRRQSADKRSADRAAAKDPEVLASMPANQQLPSYTFDTGWAREVLHSATECMRAECQSSGRPDIWGVFEARILGPILQGTSEPTYDELVERFGFRSPTQASNVLITAKRMFQRNLRAVIAEYADSPAGIEDEIRDLREILSRAGAGPA